MKFNDAIQNVSTFTDLKRFANEYVIDYKRLSFDELKAACIKTAPQYSNEGNIATVVRFFELHPNSVKLVRFENKIVDTKLLRSVTSYVLVYVFIIIVSVFFVSYENFDFETTFSSVIETFNNIGQGLGRIGPTGNFSIFSDFSKVIFILLMLIGRLEIFPVLLMFSRKTWKREV